MNIYKNFKINLSLVVLGVVNIQVQSHCGGVNPYLSPVQFNNHIFRRMLSVNESDDVVVETPIEETFNKKNEPIDEKFEEWFYSNGGEQTVEQLLSKTGDAVCHGFGSCVAKRANSLLRLCNIKNEENILNDNDLLNQYLNGDVLNIFNENKSLFKDLLNEDICNTKIYIYILLFNFVIFSGILQIIINKEISLLGNESEETNKLLALWKRVVKNEESKYNLLKRNLYQHYLKLRNKSRLPIDTLNNILNECNMVVKKYNNNYDKTLNEKFQGWSTVTPHNIFEFKMFVMACRLTWRRIIKKVHTEYTELLKISFK
ncbi:putative exported protein [Plasmodium reichenowi]|uniref:Putative exported protein n=1 Tax=Plasmodium reichenowi TaxID=5854 RepID=A0A151L252_PLARE|nr:putative exported protein [Plasmodium reichenowi]KYN93031.1 putative exported protein [Plasmodium reichenowi]